MPQDSMKKRVCALILGLVINALGSGLTVSTNVGTNPWTASELNLCLIIGWDIGWTMFAVGVIVIIINQLLIHRFDWVRLVGELIFISCFSYFIDIFVDIFNKMGVAALPFYMRTILCLIGVIVFSCATSFYQRANIFMYPNDDTTSILRFLYLRNNVVRAQFVNFMVPMVISFICYFFTKKLVGINIGTVFCLLFTGPLIAFSDKFLWRSLHHTIRQPKEITEKDI